MKRKKPDAISPEDALLFREAIGSVRRIHAQAPPKAKPPAARPRMQERDEAEALASLEKISAEELQTQYGENLSYRRSDLSPRIFKRLQRGEFAIEDELDLHGLPEHRAKAMLKTFLNQVYDAGYRCVLIIHGKGLRSEAGPVLKQMVAQNLCQRAGILGFCSAPPAMGGTGAVLVLLQKNAR